MTRLSLIALVLFAAACNAANGSKLDARPARNLVCERVALLNEKATCKPELSGEGPLVSHSARVTLSSPDGKPSTVVCGLNAGQLSMACGSLEAQPQQGSVAK